jgi:hypothetical protein
MKTAIALDPRYRTHLPPLAAQHLHRLHRFVRDQLTSLRAIGEPALDELTASDVIATMLLRDYRKLVKDPVRRAIGCWLIRCAIEQLETGGPEPPTRAFHGADSRSRPG